MLGGKGEPAERVPVAAQASVPAKPPQSAQEPPEIRWIEAADNPWGVRLLDVRPVTLTMLSTSSDPQCATNAVSFGQEDGTCFIGQSPDSQRVIDAALRFPVDGALLDGVLFIPREMEHKWALFFHRGELIVVRSWLRKVIVVARVEAQKGHVEITQVRGTLCAEDESPEFTIRALDFLLRSHALGDVIPAPLPPGIEADPEAAAMWCMSLFGNRAQIATPHVFPRQDPTRPLRTHSLLHIAVARAQIEAIDACLQAGMPIDALAADGLAPLHWALASKDNAITNLLLDRGASVDVRSEEGATPLMNAVQAGSLEQAALLLDRGADANARDMRGFTSLHRAAEMGLVDIVCLLLDRGASIDVDAEGHTPRSLAEGRDRKDILALFDRHIGRVG
ncbi:MAG: ankyrin repeat domain-containing protein [Xanthomonadaceae bacterium]|nr:ankyrin repeat domain-containing protein [Xanthomonadaceae bacterium]